MQKLIIYSLFILTLYSCNVTRGITAINNGSQKVYADSIVHDPKIEAFLAPYRAEVDKKMNDTLAQNPKELAKHKVESELGNWVADGMKWYVETQSKTYIDIAFCNYGGLRTKSIPQGAVQLKHIYELMPFENQLVLVEVDSNELKQIMMRIIEKDGWPVSKGFKLVIGDNHQIDAWSVFRDKKNSYKIVVSDYIANGGDNMDMLKSKAKLELNVLIRDALIAYARHQGTLAAVNEGRIVKLKGQHAGE
jgi:2',3'-cyclic-nucleotide 2'-phosphodiesterase (5'-nucleotidase family)